MEENKDINNQNNSFENSMFNSDSNIDDGLGDIFPESDNSDVKETKEEIQNDTETKNEELSQTEELKEEPVIEENPVEDKQEEQLEVENIEADEQNINTTADNIEKEQKVENNYVKFDDFENESDDNAASKEDTLITVRPVKFQKFDSLKQNLSMKRNLDIMQDIPMHISVELGRTKSTIKEIINLEEGSVIELDKIAGEQVEVYVNEKLVARGEVVVIEDKFGVRIVNTNIPKEFI